MPLGGVTWEYVQAGLMQRPFTAAGIVAGWASVGIALIILRLKVRVPISIQLGLWMLLIGGILTDSLFWAGVLNGHASTSAIPDEKIVGPVAFLGIATAAAKQIALWPVAWTFARVFFITNPLNQARMDTAMLQTLYLSTMLSVGVLLAVWQTERCAGRCWRWNNRR